MSGISKVIFGNATLLDLTSDTVVADKLFYGYTAHSADGDLVTGTAKTVAIYSGTSEPESTLGNIGDLYIKIDS